MIAPHGGHLINRTAPTTERDALRRRAADMPIIDLNLREFSDLVLLANGAMSPLQGFMTHKVYESVLNNMRLPSGLAWTLPVTLSVKGDDVSAMRPPFDAALRSPEGEIIGMIAIDEIYTVDKDAEAQRALQTTDPEHPGVQYLQNNSGTYAGGKVTMIERVAHPPFEAHDLEPAQTRELFASKEWNSVCAFQTRNPIHRAHEHLIRCALETVDGFLIHPAMGETKSGDIPADVRMKCYLALTENYFPPHHIALSIFPYAMRYAGPREAIFHATLRQNYGCSHFIVGRDHAGVGDYYGTYDAQKIFGEFTSDELAITPVFFEHSFYCKQCEGMASQKTCAHGKDDRVFLSGTKVREMLANGEQLPPEFTRREVAAILERHYAPAR